MRLFSSRTCSEKVEFRNLFDNMVKLFKNKLTADGILLLGHGLEQIEQLGTVIGRVRINLARLGAKTLDLLNLGRHPLEPVVTLNSQNLKSMF